VNICGLQKLTLLDYPGHLACTVFLGGCNLRCPFCHNASLVVPGKLPEPLTDESGLLDFLQSRKGKLTGVCITGGEPTLNPGLPSFIHKIKAMGFSVKLDTNGSNPRMLRELLDSGLPDYVAMDIKNSPERYSLTCGGVDVLDKVRQSVSILMNDSVAYEFRTTVCHPLHTSEDMVSIGKWLQGAKAYYLQQFIDSGDLVGTGITSPDKKTMEDLRQAVLPYINNTHLRGI